MTTATQDASSPQTSAADLKPVDPKTVADWLRKDEAKLIDVREPAEHRSAHIKEAEPQPLSGFDPAQVDNPAGKKLVVHCKSGTRSKQACQKLIKSGSADEVELYYLEGGIEAWRSAGLPVESAGGGVIDIQRQVQLVVGSMVLVFTLLGAFVNPWLLIVPAFFGAGLTFAGASGTCGMAMLLAKMPWNR